MKEMVDRYEGQLAELEAEVEKLRELVDQRGKTIHNLIMRNMSELDYEGDPDKMDAVNLIYEDLYEVVEEALLGAG